MPNVNYKFTKWNDGVTTIIRADVTNNPDPVVVMAGFREIDAPIPISSAGDMARIGKDSGFPLDADYQLTTNLNLSDFTPIGSEDAPFTGAFLGGGHTISFRINRPSGAKFNGLFGYARNAKICGVNLKDVTVTGGENTGALVGYCENTYIEKCGVSGRSVVTGTDNVGGLIGYLGTSAVNYCYSHAAVSASYSGGGLIGAISRGSVFQGYSTGKVTGTGAGGFIGTCNNCADEREAVSCYWDTENSGTTKSGGGRGVRGADKQSMYFESTYTGWNISAKSAGAKTVWVITSSLDYPELSFADVAYSMPKKNNSKPSAAQKPLVKIHGAKIIVNAPAGSAVTVRLIDMKGRIAARYNAAGPANFSLTGTPSGRYIAETKINGKRADVKRIVFSGYGKTGI